MAARRTRRTSYRRARHNWLWVRSAQYDVGEAAQATNEFSCVTGSDWEKGTGVEKATLTRIRGSLNIYPIGAAASAASCVIWVVSSDVAGIAPNEANFNDNDVLWMEGPIWNSPAAASPAYNHRLPIDIRVKRIINNGQDVRCAIYSTAAGGTYDSRWNLSCLLDLGSH